MDSPDLLALGADVEWPGHEAAGLVRDAVGEVAELGRLAELAEWVAGVRPHGRGESGRFERVRVLVVGSRGDEPAGPCAAEIADRVGAGLLVIDDLPETVDDAVAAGVALADSEVDAGADLLAVACPAVRADAAVLVALLTNTEPVKVLRRGASATDPEAWMALAVEVRDTRRRCLGFRDDPVRLLDALNSPRLAAVAALVLRAAARRTPVLLDGPSAAAAALVAYEAQARAVRWWAAADLGPEPLHELALTRIGQHPILGLGTGLGDGTAALLAVPAVQAAAGLADRALRDADVASP